MQISRVPGSMAISPKGRNEFLLDQEILKFANQTHIKGKSGKMSKEHQANSLLLDIQEMKHSKHLVNQEVPGPEKRIMKQ